MSTVPRRGRPGGRGPATLAVVVALVLGAPAAATALTRQAPAAPSDGTVSWAVDPATADGPDERRWVELELDPGVSVTEHLAVRNLGREEVTFTLSAADGYLTDTGRFTMLPAGTPSTGAGTWIDVPASVTVAAGGTAVVPYTVSVPADATPGDHAAGVAASVRTVGTGASAGVGVDSRVGFRVVTRVSGEVVPSVAVAAVRTSYDVAWNPLTPGAVDVRVEVVNDGNAALVLDATATVAGRGPVPLGVPGGAARVELLPGDVRTLTARVEGVWPLGPVTTQVDVTAPVVDVPPRATGTDGVDVTARATDRTWALPLPQAALAVGVGLLLLALRSDRRRRRDRLTRLLADARAAGRAEATAAPAPTR